jgi:uncharacterized membrane protein YgcG
VSFIISAASITTIVFGVVALMALGLGVYWLFNKRTRLRDIARLRKQLDKLKPTDPVYGAVRALYTSMVIDAHRWGFFHSDSGSDGSSGSADHSGGDHSGGGGDHH